MGALMLMLILIILIIIIIPLARYLIAIEPARNLTFHTFVCGLKCELPIVVVVDLLML